MHGAARGVSGGFELLLVLLALLALLLLFRLFVISLFCLVLRLSIDVELELSVALELVHAQLLGKPTMTAV